MRAIVSVLFLCLACSASAQRTYSNQELKRLADFGRLWGMLHNFHPKMGTGEIATDSLILTPSASLIADPSAANFERCVKAMLSRLNDAPTQLISKSNSASTLLFTNDPYQPTVHKLPNDILYVAFPTAAAQWEGLFSMPGLNPSQWDSAKAIILDIRNTKNALPGGSYAFQYNLPGFVDKLLGGVSLPNVYTRSIYHDGFMFQGDRKLNSSGWQISTQGGWPVLPSSGNKFQKPLLIIFNSGTVMDLTIANFIQSLKAAGLCKIVFEGCEGEYPLGKLISVHLTDSLIVNLRVSDCVVGDNQLVPTPDWRIDQVTDTSLTGSFVQKCIELLSTKTSDQQVLKSTALSMEFVPPLPGRYANELYPSAEKRLYALYIWWNAINYFFPYKHLIGRDWNNVLTEYIPSMINAQDSLAYFNVLRGMIYEINDSHASWSRNTGLTLLNTVYGYWPPLKVFFVENKLIVVKKTVDSLQDMSKVELWDEIVEIDGKNISEVKKEWNKVLKKSNENTYLRDLPNFLLRGSLNSTISLGILRNGRKFTVDLKRSGAYFFDYKWLYFQDKFSAYQFLEDGIGYIKMAALLPIQVDSAMNLFKNSKAIIIDLREYPRGAAESIASRIACQAIQAAMYDWPHVTSGYIHGGAFDSSSNVSYFTVKPAAGNNCYTGKIVLLVNEMTQSSGEISAMMLKAASKNSITIGSQTAGANGGSTRVSLPGGYFGHFTSIGVKYPDGGQTQRVGIKVDIEVKPTIAGFKAGKDEVLLRALKYIKEGK